VLIGVILLSFADKKVRQRELPHRKTPTPIVAKQISSKAHGYSAYINLTGICAFAKFTRLSMRGKKGNIHPFRKREKYPCACFMKFVWHPHYNKVSGVCK
jgi:hypothetical protein